MIEHQRWAIITSDQVRHRYFANIISGHPLVDVLVIQPKQPTPMSSNTSEDKGLLEAYFAKRLASEEDLLSDGHSWNLRRPLEIVHVESGSINRQQTVEHLASLGVNHCLVYGSSWLKAHWLEAFPGRIFNLHLGLSPYYRGTATNFWPLHDGLPEYVGATIHRIDAGIDTGPIVFQVRPDPAITDDAHSLGNKTIAKSVEALLSKLAGLATAPAVPQRVGSHPQRTFRAKDFDSSRLKVMLDRLAHGMMAGYVNDLFRRASQVELIDEYRAVVPRG